MSRGLSCRVCIASCLRLEAQRAWLRWVERELLSRMTAGSSCAEYARQYAHPHGRLHRSLSSCPRLRRPAAPYPCAAHGSRHTPAHLLHFASLTESFNSILFHYIAYFEIWKNPDQNLCLSELQCDLLYRHRVACGSPQRAAAKSKSRGSSPPPPAAGSRKSRSRGSSPSPPTAGSKSRGGSPSRSPSQPPPGADSGEKQQQQQQQPTALEEEAAAAARGRASKDAPSTEDAEKTYLVYSRVDIYLK